MVYEAPEMKLDRLLALKFLPKHLLCDKEAKSRLSHKAKATSALNRPDMTAIYEIDEAENGCSICGEHVEGKPIKQLLFVTDASQTDPRCP